MFDKIQQIQAACQYGAVIIINNHIAVNHTAAETLEELRKNQALCTSIHMSEEIEKEVILTDKLVIIKLQLDSFIPKFIICHHSLAGALDVAWELLKREKLI